VTVIEVPSTETEGVEGGSGIVAGITAGLDAGDSGPGPVPFTASMVHVYDLPFVSPDTVMGDTAALLPVPVAPPLEDVQVALYAVIGLSPVSEGAVNVTTICALPGSVAGAAGAPGASAQAGVATSPTARSAPSAAATPPLRRRLRLPKSRTPFHLTSSRLCPIRQ
jgi:hypothetical protein